MIRQNYIVCLKYGTKYSATYVNTLFNMCSRHTSNFKFVCMTDDATDINPEIQIIDLPNCGITGWWYKLWVFSGEFPLKGTILFLDLDLVIVNNIDYLWTYKSKQFCIIRDFNRVTVKNWAKFNSSVFRFESQSLTSVWDSFISDTRQMVNYHGDQDWLYDKIKTDFNYWPDIWIQSYKWEVRNRGELISDENRVLSFMTIAEPLINHQTGILAFHGTPNPCQVEDPIIVNNWG